MELIYPRETFLSEIGSQLTQGLFYEYRHQTTTTEKAPYTLKDVDWKGSKSMYKIYMSCASEYEAALKLLGSWSHWVKLTNCAWFQPYLEAWRHEVEIREAAIGKATIIQKALEGNVTAAKELVNQIKVKGSKGRPTKAQQEAYKDKMSAVDQKVVSILERAGNV